MLLEGSVKPLAKAPLPKAKHSLVPQDDNCYWRMQLPAPPSLPPMSSLLSRHEKLRMDQQLQPYPPRSLQPQNNQVKHPLCLSQMESSAPIQHIYHPPRENANISRSRADPLSVPIKSANRFAAPMERGMPPTQQRQCRKITQGQDENLNDHIQDDKPSTIVQARSNAAENGCDSTGQGIVTPPRKDINPAIPPAQKATSPRDSQTTSVPISGLLGESSCELVRTTTKYKITVRQQPLAARACGFGERDRRVIDPPPILQLVIEDPTATPEEFSARLRQPYVVVHCTLWNPVTDKDDTAMPGATDKRQQRRLMGTLVSSPFVGLDENDIEGCFFTFPDLSVRTPGAFSLKFSLIMLDPVKMAPGNSAVINATVKTDVFHVYNAKDFRGMRPSTELTKRLKQQGCLISVKKGNTKSGRARDEDDDEEDDDDDDLDVVMKPPRAKRGKRL